MSKEEIITASEKIFSRFSETCSNIDDPAFFKKPGNKWSAAENMQHLIISTGTSTLAYSLPKFLVKWIGGKPNRNPGSYDELKQKYLKKLSEGGKASARFVPKPIDIKYGKERLLYNWNKTTTKYIRALAAKRTETDLDSYLVKHPLLGRITLRELGYFTIFHTEHHLNSIHKSLTATQ